MAKILLIEDDHISRLAMREYLKSAGHSVVEVDNGADGCRLEAEQAFDLVVTDIIMSDKEGMATIIDIKERSPDQRIIAVTGGEGKKADAQAADEFGANFVLFKPFTESKFMICVEECLLNG